MVLIPSSVSKSTGKYCLMKHCMVTLPFPILKSKGKYCMAEKPSHVSRVSLSYPVEIGLTLIRMAIKKCLAMRLEVIYDSRLADRKQGGLPVRAPIPCRTPIGCLA